MRSATGTTVESHFQNRDMVQPHLEGEGCQGAHCVSGNQAAAPPALPGMELFNHPRAASPEVVVLTAATCAAGVSELECIIGRSPAMREFKALLGRVAALRCGTVLITGETGTGKDLAARTLHGAGLHRNSPFMHITCSALSEHLLESELFGHERGSFTDAKAQKRGLFELARDGTVFLDEIGELPLALQAKLLRFLEEKTFMRVGGTVDVRVEATVVAATNRDLRAEVKAGRFREDLYYRLHVMPLVVPPLRARTGDVPLLVRFYMDRFNAEFSRSISGTSREAMDILQKHNWPGNVRELRNVVQRAMLLTNQTVLLAEDISTNPSEVADAAPLLTLPAQGLDFDHLERSLVAQALTRAGGNQTRAGALLGMNRDQIRYRMNKFGIGRPPREAHDNASPAETPAPHPCEPQGATSRIGPEPARLAVVNC